MKLVKYKDGSEKLVSVSWEYEGDPDYLETVEATDEDIEKYLATMDNSMEKAVQVITDVLKYKNKQFQDNSSLVAAEDFIIYWFNLSPEEYILWLAEKREEKKEDRVNCPLYAGDLPY